VLLDRICGTAYLSTYIVALLQFRRLLKTHLLCWGQRHLVILLLECFVNVLTITSFHSVPSQAMAPEPIRRTMSVAVWPGSRPFVVVSQLITHANRPRAGSAPCPIHSSMIRRRQNCTAGRVHTRKRRVRRWNEERGGRYGGGTRQRQVGRQRPPKSCLIDNQAFTLYYPLASLGLMLL